MGKSAWTCLAALAFACASTVAAAEFNKPSHLNAEGQSKVNKALAKGWSAGDKSATAEGRSVVNVGSKKAGNCTVNIGTTQKAKPGEQAPKEVVVTAKEVINVCK